MFPVRLEVDEYDPRVRVGMSAEAEIVVEKAENVLVVPLRQSQKQEVGAQSLRSLILALKVLRW